MDEDRSAGGGADGDGDGVSVAMCVVSMVTDHYRERWFPYVPAPALPYIPYEPQKPQEIDYDKLREMFAPQQSPITQEEIAEFRRLLERAREYDKRMNEPDCELDEKRIVIKRIAAVLGIDISFVDAPASQ